MANGKIEGVIMHLLSALMTDTEHYCDLETIDGTAICANDGSLATIVRFNGTKSVLSRERFLQMIGRLEQSMSVFFSTRGHQLQVVFRRDLDASMELDANAAQQRMSAERLQLDLDDIINESCEKYKQFIYDEQCYMVFWSRPALLDASEVRMARAQMNEFRNENNWPSVKDGQNILRPISFLYDRHQAFVAKIVDDVSSPEFGCSVDRINVTESLRAVRRSVFPEYTSHLWQPSIPGNGMSPSWKTNNDENDASEMFYPALPHQIMVGEANMGNPKDQYMPDPTTVCLGGRMYAPLLVEKHALDPQTFNVLFDALNRAEIRENGQTRALPYSISFMIESDGMSVFSWKTMFSTVLGMSSEVNRNINLASKDLKEAKRDGECMVKLRIAAMTWVGSDLKAHKELAGRKSKLWRIMEGWGSMGLMERTGNPLKAFQSNAVGLSWKHIGNPAPAPLGEALAMMPFTRPASAFNSGSNIFRSLDGKIMRYQRFAAEQSSWLTLTCGKPGFGKSVLLNNNNFEACIMPGLSRLPFECTIDIGISSEGAVNLVKDNLPEHLKHLALYKRLQNHERDCINMMDTPLGQRVPLPRHRSFLVNFLTALATPPERSGKPYEGMSAFVGRVIDGAFKNKSDKHEKGQPNTYRAGFDPVVDEAVSKIDFPVRSATTYFELADELFKAGDIYGCEVTQRYAMPTLEDLVAYAASPDVVTEYGSIKVESGAPINDAFKVGVREAINDFPIFRDYTKFDIGSARIMSLDLQDVAIQGSDAAIKQTALMYMVARESFMKKVAFSKEDLPFFDPLYRPYYNRLISELAEDYKVLSMDEFHKTKGHQLLRDQLMTDAREARKWQLEISLASQLMEDFGELTKIATSFFILDPGTPETRKWMRDNIGLSAVEEGALINYVRGPKAHGSTFLARFVTNDATYSQLYTMTVGPMRLWGLSTTAEDRKLRSLLYEAVPGNVARELLAKRFPSGSCKNAVQTMKREMSNVGEFIDDDMSLSIIDRIGDEILAEHFGARRALAA